MSLKAKRKTNVRKRPGEIRDAIVGVLSKKSRGATVGEIQDAVHALIGSAAPSSVQSYLRLNSDSLFRRRGRGVYTIRETADGYGEKVRRQPSFRSSQSAGQLWLKLTVSNGCGSSLKILFMR